MTGPAMTPARLAHLLRAIPAAASGGELDGMQGQLQAQGELTTDVMAALRDRRAALGSR